jgi:hypothetical protein
MSWYVESQDDMLAERKFLKKNIIGLSLADAREKCKVCHIRAIKIDGVDQMTTKDNRVQRINVVVKDDKITEIKSFG